MKIKLHHQPTGNSCGPTCLYMAFEAVVNWGNSLSSTVPVKHTIKDIAEMCGTDWEVGTPPDRMERGMKALNLNYVEHMCSPRPYDLLRQVIEDGNIPILRTITKGVPHWIIVNEVNFVYPEIFKVLDPWQGSIQYSEKELDEIWKVRNYQFFEIIINKKQCVKSFVNPQTGNFLFRRYSNITQDFYLGTRKDED